MPALSLSSSAATQQAPVERSLSASKTSVVKTAASVSAARTPPSPIVQGKGGAGLAGWGEDATSLQGGAVGGLKRLQSSDSCRASTEDSVSKGIAGRGAGARASVDPILLAYLRTSQEQGKVVTPSCPTPSASSVSAWSSNPATPRSVLSLSTPASIAVSGPGGTPSSTCGAGSGNGWWPSHEYPSLGGGASIPSTPESVDSRGGGRGSGAWGSVPNKGRGGGFATPGTPSSRDGRGVAGGGSGVAGGEEYSMDKYDLDRFEEYHTVFEEHLSQEEALRQVKARILLTGTVHVDPNTLRTTVLVDASCAHVAEEVVIDGWFARNRALNGDKVCAHAHSFTLTHQHGRKRARALAIEKSVTCMCLCKCVQVAVKLLEDDGNARETFDIGSRHSRTPHRPPDGRQRTSGGGGRDSWGSGHSGFGGGGGGGGGGGNGRLGKVVALLKANRDISLVCMLAPVSASAAGSAAPSNAGGGGAKGCATTSGGHLPRRLMQPLDKSAPKMTLVGGAELLPVFPSTETRHLYLVRWCGWETRFATPRGTLVKVLPVLDSIDAGLEAIVQQYGMCLDHGLTREGHPIAVSAALPVKGWAEGGEPADEAAEAGDVGASSAVSDPYAGLLNDFPESWSIPWSVRRQRQTGTATHLPPNTLVMTIDSDGALDLDDAVSVVQLPNGNLQLGIHISDVSYFVEPGSKLNAVAAQRASSLYLASGHTLPMLPPRLANNLCSLLPNQERLCVSASFEVTQAGRLVRPLGAARTIVRSHCRLTYAQADMLLAHGPAAAPAGAFDVPHAVAEPTGAAQGGSGGMGRDAGGVDQKPREWWQSLVEDLSLLAAAAGGMRASRLASGALDFGELPLLKLSVEKSDVSVSEYDALGEQSRQLVSELMLLLNSWVAQVLGGPSVCAYHRHSTVQYSTAQHSIARVGARRMRALIVYRG